MSRARAEHGQVMPLAAVGLLVVLLGFAGLAIDVGSWYRAQRHVQAVADAAALAAVQALPGDRSGALALAREYARKNGGSIDDPRFTSAYTSDDTIRVDARADAPGFFSRIVGIDHVAVHASASARAAAPDVADDVVPLAVSSATPALSCGLPCIGQEATLQFDNGTGGVQSAWGMIDFSNGNANPPTVAGWLTNGYDKPLPVGDYQSDPGNKFRAGPVRDALEQLAAERALVVLPVWSTVTGNGANAIYHVVGFSAFRITGFDAHAGGSASSITGEFETLVTHGGGHNPHYFGVKAVKLVDDGGNGNGGGGGGGD
jgi:hypothetical protein